MSKNRPYQICTKTIMDTSDPNIVFDEKGISDYYHNFHENILPNWHTDEKGFTELMQVADKIKKEGIGKDFDCIIGLSGGLDSSYVAYVAKEILGLRPLLFHVDAGWNTDKIDVVSDILKIPCPDASFDIILCSEVLEHVPEPTHAILEFSRLLKPNGLLILTAPFASFLHMAPYHFSTGFTRYWYEHHLAIRGFSITVLEPNGSWSSVLMQELQRLSGLARANKSLYWPFIFLYTYLGCTYLRLHKYLAQPDFACFGFHCVAVKL